jgi:hypothetical protein
MRARPIPGNHPTRRQRRQNAIINSRTKCDIARPPPLGASSAQVQLILKARTRTKKNNSAKNTRQRDKALKAFLKLARADRKPSTPAKSRGGKASSARAVTRRKVKPAFSGEDAPAKVASSATSPAAPINQ